MKILVTGAKGFVGKNLIAELKNSKYTDIFEYDINNSLEDLDKFTCECDFVFHLAGVNRPQDQKEFMKGNFGFTSVLLNSLKKYNNKAPVLITSSIQAEFDNPYGKSKKAGEDLLFNYSKENNSEVFVYRLPNVFGKWCRPNYNSAVSTFCNNIANDLPITVNNRETIMKLVYIDDVVNEFINALNGNVSKKDNYCYIPTVHKTTLGEIADLLYSFKESRKNLSVPDLSNSFTTKLYATYLSYLPENEFSYKIKMNKDDRGSFTEIIRTLDRGQFSVNVTKPGITKGNHWHHTKNEKFVVVSGKGLIQFRKIGSDKVIEYNVNGEDIEVIDIPVGYTHNIKNVGDDDLITFMWASEPFNPEKPDTYYEIV